MMGTQLQRWSSGTGKVLNVGDQVRIDTGKARFKITALVETPAGVEVHAYGGKGGHMRARVFTVDQVTRVRDQTTDPNRHERVALHVASEASKKRKGRRR